MEDFDLELDKMELVAAAAGYYYYNSITRQPRHSSLPYGSSFMSEVLEWPLMMDAEKCFGWINMFSTIYVAFSDKEACFVIPAGCYDRGADCLFS
ncbi:hypothetical protein OIU77_027820 [Salix suchowensis]|uniref:Uncharacterized protein n=1 Tax=Salix suchowensis TaxID=1278906 RepID=A0ABQ9BRE6_9ROSI|nr:hypothetical protein OIU77_027820 [Salix suchowensis]